MATESGSQGPPAAYDGLLETYRRIVNVDAAESLLNWDQQVMMPEGGTPARARQLSTLSSLSHELLIDDRVADRLRRLGGAELDDAQRAVVREIGRQHRRAAAVPPDLVEEISRTAAEAHPVWKEAKAMDDFAAFAPILERLVELKREYATAIDPSRDPYVVLYEEYEPYLPFEAADRVLERLRDELVDLLEAIESAPVEPGSPFEGSFDDETQAGLCRAALDALGYDWDRGRLDTAPHPFSTGTQFDARVTTRYEESDLLGAVTSTIHEFGHACYTQGLPTEAYGSPLGESRDMTVHESQSRFWENHIGRSLPFWETFAPTVGDRVPALAGLDPVEAYEAANRVYPDNLIRVEADELTYHLHIVLRYEIERALVRGNLSVPEVPRIWNDKMEAYLGVRPDSDATGCLQDIHWSYGAFGYFPTYSLGSVLAAQIDHRLRAAIDDVDAAVADGDFDPIRRWLRSNVHRHGCRYPTPELIEIATGDAFRAAYFLEYVTEKFGALYDLD